MIGVSLKLDDKTLRMAQHMLQDFPAILAEALAKALLQIAAVVQAQAKSVLRGDQHIDTGALRASIHIVIADPLTVFVGTSSEYAAAVEFGTIGHYVKVDSVPGMREWLVSHGIPEAETRTYFYVNPKPSPFMKTGYLMGQAMAPTTVEAAIEAAFGLVESRYS